METLRSLLGGTFFKALPPKIKVILHGLELLLGSYFVIMLAVKELYHEPVMTPFYTFIAQAYITAYPFVRFLIQVTSGVGSTPPGTPPPTPPKSSDGN